MYTFLTSELFLTSTVLPWVYCLHDGDDSWNLWERNCPRFVGNVLILSSHLNVNLSSGLLLNLLTIYMSEKTFCLVFWKIFFLKIVLYIESSFSVHSLKCFSTYILAVLFWPAGVLTFSSVFDVSFPLMAFNISSLSLEVNWLWYSLEKFSHYFFKTFFCSPLLFALGVEHLYASSLMLCSSLFGPFPVFHFG